MRTIEEIKSDDNFLCGLELPEYKLNVYLTWIGIQFVQYDIFLNGKLLFAGKDFKPAPSMNFDTVDTIVSLLGFITLKEGDTDKKYFAKYTPEQWAWSKSKDCEDLGNLVNDFEDSNPDDDAFNYHKDAVDYFNQHFIQ